MIKLMSSIKTETETVVKKVLPYLSRRGYDIQKDLDFETAVNTTDRYSKGFVDIIVTGDGNKPAFLIEAKKSSKKLTTADRDQAISYAKDLKVFFVVVTNGNDIQCYNAKNKLPIRWNGKLSERIPTKSQLKFVVAALKSNTDATDIPLSQDQSLPFRPGLPLKQLNALFARCHNTIRKIEKDEEYAFADFSKLLFLKLLEEKSDTSKFDLPYSYRFHELAEKPASEADQVKVAILGMIEEIKKRTSYGDVLEDPIHLKNPRTFCYIVQQLSSVSLYDSSLDSKGAAFEYFVRATLKGKKLGQYFTPRPLVEVMLHLVGREKIVSSITSGTPIKVLDPACGTGGFLVFLMQENLKMLEERYRNRQITRTTFDDVSKRLIEEVFYGSDANPGVACAAKMNMIISGDGHTNIRAENSLSKEAKNWSLDKATCDLIMTNPPFGTSESDSDDLSSFPLPRAKGQYLFLQKMVLSTKSGGEICTVIDEGVLNTDTAIELRKWLLQHCKLLAVLRLPDDTFKPNKINVRSSVLYMQRYEDDDVDHDAVYSATFCDLQSLGYIGSGDAIRGFNFQQLLNEVSLQVLDQSQGSLRSGSSWRAFDVSIQDIYSDTSSRLDLKYWEPETRKAIANIGRAGAKSILDLNLIKTERGASPPADLYVDEADGYALVVKAGSNISKFGQLIPEGDFIQKDLYDEYLENKSRNIIQNGDVLLSSTGDGTLGKCCVYRDDKPAIADVHVTIIRADTNTVSADYLCDYLRCGFGATQIERLYSGSTGLIELTPEHVDSIVVDLLSDVAEQERVSHQLRDKENIYEQALIRIQSELGEARRQFTKDTS